MNGSSGLTAAMLDYLLSMPFKHNATCRHRIPRTRYRVTNWPAYEAALPEPEVVTMPARRDWRFEALGFSEAERVPEVSGFPTRTILCNNDRTATGVMAAAFRHGLKVGRGPDADLRIAGHDNQPLSRYTCPLLTTIAQDFEQLGARALDLLLDQISGGGDKPAEQVRLETRLVMRQSA